MNEVHLIVRAHCKVDGLEENSLAHPIRNGLRVSLVQFEHSSISQIELCGAAIAPGACGDIILSVIATSGAAGLLVAGSFIELKEGRRRIAVANILEVIQPSSPI